MVTIYIRNKPLFLVDSIDTRIEDYLHRPTTIFMEELSDAAVKTMLHEMDQQRFYYGVIKHNNLPELLAAFKAELQVLVASGGLVRTAQNDLLLIHRLGRWDLPKGKLDAGETLEECALREIEEETGAKNLSIEQPLQVTYHTYYQNDVHILKESHWYLVKAAEKTPLAPQTEESIEQCLWVPVDEVAPYIDGAFPSVADVLTKGLKVIRK